jgi:mRNA interferase HigB
MWIITERRLLEAMEQHPNAKAPLMDWMIKIRAARPSHIHDLRQIMGSVDVAYNLTIFDIGGNNFRLVADVVYEVGRVYIKEFMTHAEYNEWNKQMRSSK